jgi:hypothetical protein
MRKVTLLLSMLASVFGGASLGAFSASAQDAETIADLRCLIIGFKFAGSPTESLKQAGLIETLYYLGRIDARNPNIDLENQVANVLAKMTESDVKAESRRCGAVLSQRGEALQQLGKNIISRGQN